jgi:hypothetical protein
MAVILKNAFLGWAVGGLVLSLVGPGITGCSDSSAGPSAGDASLVDGPVDAAPPPLGVPVANCAACNSAVCGGVLGSATTGITYCTEVCTSNSDCPMGTGCVANSTSKALSNNCLATCTADTDCTAPFICRSDLGSPGSYCWSPYPPVGGATSDAGDAAVAEAGAPDTGTPPSEAGAPPDSGEPTDSGAADAAADAAATDASDASAD